MTFLEYQVNKVLKTVQMWTLDNLISELRRQKCLVNLYVTPDGCVGSVTRVGGKQKDARSSCPKSALIMATLLVFDVEERVAHAMNPPEDLPKALWPHWDKNQVAYCSKDGAGWVLFPSMKMFDIPSNQFIDRPDFVTQAWAEATMIYRMAGSKCLHLQKSYHPDPSGNNDSSYTCSCCGVEV